MKQPPFYKSLWFSVKGAIYMLKSERNFQIEVFALLINLFLMVYLKLNSTDVAIIVILCFSVLSLEIVNSCVEKICDMIQPDYDERIKIIKDIAAAAVVIMAFASVIVGFLVYYKYIF